MEGGAAAPQIFGKFYFLWIERNSVKVKIVENYKTSWNSSKLIDIYNIIVELDARDDILYPVGNELREIFSFLIVQPLSQYTGHHPCY